MQPLSKVQASSQEIGNPPLLCAGGSDEVDLSAFKKNKGKKVKGKGKK